MPCYIGHSKTLEGARFFFCGNLGPHCSDCMDAGELLCDYPVGDGKTCDRTICANHAVEVADNVHYCLPHHQEWLQFVAAGGDAGSGGAIAAAAVAKAKELEALARKTASASSRYELQAAKEAAAKLVAAIDGSIQQHSGTVTASKVGPSQTLDCGAAGPTRTGDLLITNQPTDSAIYPDNQALSELSESPRPVDDGAQDSSTYADVTARGSPKLFGVDLASSRGMEHPSPRDFLLAVTSIAHCGGLVGLSPQAALSAVRFVTLPYFDPKETTGAHRRRIKVALSNKLDALLND